MRANFDADARERRDVGEDHELNHFAECDARALAHPLHDRVGGSQDEKSPAGRALTRPRTPRAANIPIQCSSGTKRDLFTDQHELQCRESCGTRGRKKAHGPHRVCVPCVSRLPPDVSFYRVAGAPHLKYCGTCTSRGTGRIRRVSNMGWLWGGAHGNPGRHGSWGHGSRRETPHGTTCGNCCCSPVIGCSLEVVVAGLVIFLACHLSVDFTCYVYG